MKVKGQMIYLGTEYKVSGKTGNEYMLVKFMNHETSEIFEFYVSGEKVAIKGELSKMQALTPATVMLSISSFQGKPQVDLDGVKQ